VEGFREQGNEPSGFNQMLGNTLIASQLADSQEWLSSKELIYFIAVKYTGCLKNCFTILKEYINLFRGHMQCFEMSQYSKTDIAPGKILTTGGTSAALPVEVTWNHNYPR
jgi:hypothetical protein